MITSKSSMSKSAFRAPGLLMTGLVVGALSFGFSEGTSGQKPDLTKGSYGFPAGTGTSGEPGVGGAAAPATEAVATAENLGFQPAMAPQGWRIRVCSEKTRADQIKFMIGPADAGKKGTTGTAGAEGTGYGGSADPAVNTPGPDQTVTWSRGEGTEIKLPAGLMTAEKIRVEAVPGEKDKKASVCVLYDDHVAKSLNFDNREVSTVKRTETGTCGC